ncbi:DNA polymerase V [Acetitomaculum ruminis DSM 5522]|uniref:DNA polymerase V n=1 Tax=Acetitomaculum ruminis DSM 5522 TaxID=1120918 RepID=A0A1I1AAK2_9FIRM|nr:DNA methylase [Acetitomaculum ruminis]SFB34562.1 DNA polymerase V [Acetitomaculum ruminis DSM 5522]
MNSDLNRQYICIDLKSFYASVECRERGLDPMTTNLVVADKSRTEKTICLAVSPSLKKYKIPGRARLYQVVQRVKEINIERKRQLKGENFRDSSYDSNELNRDNTLELSYITAPPRMALYMKYSTDIYKIYLKYASAEDIHVYSIDEVFIDVTAYLGTYGLEAGELLKNIIKDVYETTGITATAGIGSNMYLAKIAMDIVAKHMPQDENGVRIAQLDEMSYRRKLWTHRPITDFWRVGRGYGKKLEKQGIYTMGDVARTSLENEELLYKLFGVNAELLIDHAWGYEPSTIKEIKSYRPKNNSCGSGQVLQEPYDFEKGRLIVREMTDLLVLDLVEKKLLTNQLVLTVGYDIENLTDPEIRKKYKGEITIDGYGRKVPKHAHGTANLEKYSSSTKLIIEAVMKLYNEIVDKNLTIRRVNIVANHVEYEDNIKEEVRYEQMDFFTDYEALEKKKEEEKKFLEREKKAQRAVIEIKNKFGKNAILKGTNYLEGAKTIERNNQIGGHKA